MENQNNAEALARVGCSVPKLTIDVADLDRERMAGALQAALANGPTTEIAAEMKKRAAVNFQRIKGFLDTRPAH